MPRFSTLASGFALLTAAAAQSYTSCNPLDKTCSSDKALSQSTYSVDFTSGADDNNWSSIGTEGLSYTSAGAEFTITKEGDAPTIQTNWYIFFGQIEVHMKAAPGTGIVSTTTLLSDDLDEIDWEFLGGYPDEVQTDYFGKGNSTGDRGGTSDVSNTQGTSHNYTVSWTEAAIEWYIDGAVVRTLAYSEALGGNNYPQTPMRVKLGIWAGGDPTNAKGTIEWAGGETDYSAGPFTMVVESVRVTNFNPAQTYTYGDKTGDYASIKISGSGSSDDSREETSTSSSTTASATGTKNTSATLVTKTSSSVVATMTAGSNSTNSSATGVSTSATSSSNGTSSATSTSSAASSTSTSAHSGASGVKPTVAAIIGMGVLAVFSGLF